MAIQFLCPACSQPIEVDAEWGGRPVDCPYCRKRVTAPLESTYSPVPQAPQARPMGMAPAFGPVEHALTMPPAIPAGGGNAIALWALVLSLSSLACLLVGNMIFLMHWDEVEPLLRMSEEGKTFREINQAMIDQYAGRFPGWLVGAVLVFLAGLAIWVAGVVCGVIGVRRRLRRKFAVAALVVSGVVLLIAVPK